MRWGTTHGHCAAFNAAAPPTLKMGNLKQGRQGGMLGALVTVKTEPTAKTSQIQSFLICCPVKWAIFLKWTVLPQRVRDILFLLQSLNMYVRYHINRQNATEKVPGGKNF